MPDAKCDICQGNIPDGTVYCPRKCFDFCDPNLYQLYRYDLAGHHIAILRVKKSDIDAGKNIPLTVQWSAAKTFILWGLLPDNGPLGTVVRRDEVIHTGKPNSYQAKRLMSLLTELEL
jgi:hypothetical protein